jgi:hypothetical protein
VSILIPDQNSKGEGGKEEGGGGQTMYTHVSKYKNDKIKERKNRINIKSIIQIYIYIIYKYIYI